VLQGETFLRHTTGGRKNSNEMNLTSNAAKEGRRERKRVGETTNRA
jgi:hypothetical protein